MKSEKAENPSDMSVGGMPDSFVKMKLRNCGIVILHGYGGYAGEHHLFEASRFYRAKNYQVTTPELPSGYGMAKDTWLESLLNSATISENTVLIGHSTGGTLAMWVLDCLAKQGRSVAGAVLVSAFAKDHLCDGLRGVTDSFLLNEKFDFDSAKRAASDNIHVVFSDDDSLVPSSHGRYLADRFGVVPTVFEGLGHINHSEDFSLLKPVYERAIKGAPHFEFSVDYTV